MNTIRSVGYGWGVLIAAGGGAYYFAKKSINEDRSSRAQRDRELRAQQAQLKMREYGNDSSGHIADAQAKDAKSALLENGSVNPSMEATDSEPAPTRHAPFTENQKVAEKSKYEASEVWRSKKGDRFS